MSNICHPSVHAVLLKICEQSCACSASVDSTCKGSGSSLPKGTSVQELSDVIDVFTIDSELDAGRPTIVP